MKKTLLIIIAALALAACQTAGTSTKPAADIAARVCPPLQGVLALLPVTQGISPETLAKVEEATPYVAAACAPGAADLDLHALSTQAAPLLIKAVTASSLSDGEKQAAIIAVVAAQVVIAEWGAP